MLTDIVLGASLAVSIGKSMSIPSDKKSIELICYISHIVYNDVLLKIKMLI